MFQKIKKKIKFFGLSHIIVTYPYVATFFSILIVASATASLYIFAANFYIRNFLSSHIIVSVTIITIPLLMVFIRKKLYSIKGPLEKIYLPSKHLLSFSAHLENSLNNKLWSTLFPCVTSISSMFLVIINSSGWPVAPRIIFTSFIGLASLYIGSIGWFYFVIILTFRQFGDFEFEVEPLISCDYYFKNNRIYMQIYSVGFVFYIAAVLSVYFAPLGNLLLLGSSIGYFVIFPMGIIVIAYFVIIQNYLHNSILHIKEYRLEKINEIIRKEYLGWEKSSKNSETQKITELLVWQKMISEEQEWALNFQTAGTIIGTSLVPVVGAIIEIVSNLK